MSRGEYSFGCGMPDCPTGWNGDDLAQIAARAAWHWNKKHGDELRHSYKAIDTVERGGHHLHGNEYCVERIDIYVTSFDIMERIGQVDGMAVPADPDRVCDECLRDIPDPGDRVEDNPDDPFNDDWTCRRCVEEAELARRREENQQITEWVA